MTSSTGTTQATPSVGDIVGHLARPGRWRVEKILRVNIQIVGIDGQQPNRVNAKPYMLTEAPTVETTAAGSAETVDLPTYFDPGQIVTSIIPKLRGVLLVVFKDNYGDKVNCHELFGRNPGRYWTVPRTTLSLVEPADVLRVLLLHVYEKSPLDTTEQQAVSIVRAALDRDDVGSTVNRTANGNGS